MSKIGTSNGFMVRTPVKPKIDKNLKIRAMTDPEKALSEYRQKYTNGQGKVTWKGAATLIKDIGVKAFRRSFMGDE